VKRSDSFLATISVHYVLCQLVLITQQKSILAYSVQPVMWRYLHLSRSSFSTLFILFKGNWFDNRSWVIWSLESDECILGNDEYCFKVTKQLAVDSPHLLMRLWCHFLVAASYRYAARVLESFCVRSFIVTSHWYGLHLKCKPRLNLRFGKSVLPTRYSSYGNKFLAQKMRSFPIGFYNRFHNWPGLKIGNTTNKILCNTLYWDIFSPWKESSWTKSISCEALGFISGINFCSFCTLDTWSYNVTQISFSALCTTCYVVLIFIFLHFPFSFLHS
jgi:hypothetical protein